MEITYENYNFREKKVIAATIAMNRENPVK